MHRQHHKMHGGEIAFHLAVPLAILVAVSAMGYYVLRLVTDIMRIA